MIEHCKQLKSYWVAGGEIRRQIVTIDRCPVVLMHKSHPIHQPCFSQERWQSFTDVTLPSELARELKQYNRTLRFSFNCHTLSIGSLLGLDTDVWLEGTSSVFTLKNNPTQSLLDAHFHKVAEANQITDLPDLEIDDVVVFRDKQSGHLVHSGRIRFIADKPYLLSKLGEHPAAIALLEDVAQEYQGQYDRLDLYRQAAADTTRHRRLE